MNLSKIAKKILTLAFVLILIYSCGGGEDHCTKTINTPRWDPVKKTFVDNFKEVPCPCNSKKPVDKSLQ